VAADFRTQRLFVQADLSDGASLRLGRDQAHYLVNVLRARVGDEVLVFNGRDGEWRAALADVEKKDAVLRLVRLEREQPARGRIDYLFAPLKHARLDYMVQKAVEMGAARLVPVLTQHTVAQRVNIERMRANAIEAAEQCGVLAVPEILAERKLMAMLDSWEPGRVLIFCDEEASEDNPVDRLRTVRSSAPLAVLIGPEGGFSEGERARLLALPNVVRLWLGPRILRADTAAVAALALVQAAMGDSAS
jgi:16S rRNA (uracil1498-N3)-methyltransferase